ncbi:hypothetical protein IGI04_016957 [Brassica rapa subsp. trilocularis]|uniref:Rhodopsin n=1 Tax=Brassica rapa subsp. trilocularis TaxID=1813537 RepID=A0ABQ7MUQ6_BRACM|nr:hypothetical protein IGI04_016957 [Brassica rapa subsp. trilocularis]
MSQYNQPPVGVPPPQGYPPEGYPKDAYPPQGYPPQGYPPQGYPQQGYPPPYAPQYPPPPQHQQQQQGSPGFLEGCQLDLDFVDNPTDFLQLSAVAVSWMLASDSELLI